MSDRYIRQISVIGYDGQKRLQKAKILVVGAGGLGSSVIAYLAAAGVGKLGIMDGDVVEEHNLQRQIIHGGNVGINKAESAKLFVERLNPDVEVEVYPFRITPSNVMDIVGDYDIVVSCPDNLTTRYVLNDACRLLGKPIVHAAIHGFEGEAMTVIGTPCYRCVFPRARSEEKPGVIGPVAGLFGCIQAVEAIKLVLGMEVLSGRLLRADLRSMEFYEISISNNPECPVCSGRLKGIFEENYVNDCRVVRFE
ncbi:HesA/MoeB/ThiF family protein [Archaeoglobus veneficus]|uniref:UBA/THIF-type NAD/FAD binding protein n=1 Tax=Archaeoglobus veneficus (strain DSM 11195 / SNP6) TaxID=693661 RepID=F2KMZ9_ARCVS|nr:HesA/MoeB/ThiF family protein [Archaeoglobus veneficus]AEA47275.1 UBA/THIF-type NAD/FAD binding protein [Archaeoglobus veneficus SNP6]